VQRRKTRQIAIGKVKIGSDAPISVQTMTKTDTTDVDGTLAQIESVARLGCDIVRIAVPNADAADALAEITSASVLPVVADIHFHPKLAIKSIENGVDAIRINPGNMPVDGLKATVDAAKTAQIPIRIGLNSGSVRRHGEKTADEYRLADLMVDRALEYARQFEDWGFGDIKLSLKASSAASTIYAYRKAAPQCDYPLHVGVTATGTYEYAVIKTAVATGALLSEGIGDTIRVSLTGAPEAEVPVGRKILASLGLLTLPYEVLSCPTCGRTAVNLVDMAEEVRLALAELPPHDGPTIRVAVMGCEVNGPGEAADADVGVACGKGVALLFVKGEKKHKVQLNDIVKTLVDETRRMAGV
jgi:(E)-4-hydroxy-3-methylbut-2-enyl-diphosphate synthase